MGVRSKRHVPAALPTGKSRYPLYRGWVGPRAGLDGCGKSRPHRDSISDRPARRESLYRLRYLGPYMVFVGDKIQL